MITQYEEKEALDDLWFKQQHADMNLYEFLRSN